MTGNLVSIDPYCLSMKIIDNKYTKVESPYYNRLLIVKARRRHRHK